MSPSSIENTAARLNSLNSTSGNMANPTDATTSVSNTQTKNTSDTGNTEPPREKGPDDPNKQKSQGKQIQAVRSVTNLKDTDEKPLLKFDAISSDTSKDKEQPQGNSEAEKEMRKDQSSADKSTISHKTNILTKEMEQVR
ncbi:uncharacterized protein MELLADRAFT_61279 [Melampsora larici-populina 98AG31]|uniref:Uncharacterized protein n=1 Tax=Melampsora larici-populina (strain 98AG31 / pathotype 3-4-7) TaxID=747676 RepID=F4REA3_MELLP|nr:uncharacterized protein MELLADRAFT_61279 [Melampsora larici-populina 98AG31]EGG09302.1 hypothetical protein MELLADRAFT_61279 [Melampsora larici-populina 98AG31]